MKARRSNATGLSHPDGRWTRAELVRALASVPGFERPDPHLEQVVTPADPAADLLAEALARGDLRGRSVFDLGTGTGRLAIGAALLGAGPVRGIDLSAPAIERARESARSLKLEIDFRVGDVAELDSEEGTVLMNPPFGAQRRHADRPFWRIALGPGARAVYAFALADSRSFIERRAVERSAQIESVRPVPWSLPATFAHHQRRAVDLPVDLWILRMSE
ncbi:MAG TPA: methyltransferase [Thermoplasmata archaeon]|nr:methyltransferase [Thermoplasmata archaeon]